MRNSGTRAAYENAASALAVALCETRLVAAHGWDYAGALAMLALIEREVLLIESGHPGVRSELRNVGSSSPRWKLPL